MSKIICHKQYITDTDKQRTCTYHSGNFENFFHFNHKIPHMNLCRNYDTALSTQLDV